MKSPAFRFYAGDFLSSTAVAMMDPCEIGGYILLLAHDWNSDGIPDDDVMLAKLSRMGEAWGRASIVVLPCFIQHPTKAGFITNPRLMLERQKQGEWREKSSRGGKKSVKSKALRRATTLQPPLVPKAQPNGNISSSSSVLTPMVPKGTGSVEFDEFWSSYPKRVGKGAAEKAFDNARCRGFLPVVLAALERQKQTDQWRKDGGQFIPNPSTWLNQRRWEDEGCTPQPVVVDRKQSEADRRLHGIDCDELMTWVRLKYPKTPDFFGPERVLPEVVEEFIKTRQTRQA